MDQLEHLTPQKLEKVTCRLWKVSSSLNGLGSLFLYQARESCINPDEYAGIGYLLQELSKELSRIEDTHVDMGTVKHASNTSSAQFQMALQS